MNASAMSGVSVGSAEGGSESQASGWSRADEKAVRAVHHTILTTCRCKLFISVPILPTLPPENRCLTHFIKRGGRSQGNVTTEERLSL
jgi:hypothetical protein